MWKTHAVFGVMFGLIFLYFFHMSLVYSLVFLFITLIASSIPDVDAPNSKIGKKLPVISHLFKFFFGHRGFVHSIFIPLILLTIFLYLGLPFIAWGIFIGSVSHLIGDMLTREGVAPFYPILMFRIEGILKTGKIAEKVLFFIICLIDLFLFFKVF
jgi:inner membrane protein